jgi:hypothetical protein
LSFAKTSNARKLNDLRENLDLGRSAKILAAHGRCFIRYLSVRGASKFSIWLAQIAINEMREAARGSPLPAFYLQL